MSLANRAKDKAKKNPTWLLGILVIVHLIVISLNRVQGQPNIYYAQVVGAMIATPFQALASHGVGSITGIGQHYFSLRDSRAENELLKAANAALETELVAIREKAKLADQLNAINQAPALLNYPKVSARVIGRDSNPWYNTVVIDKGTSSGVEKDQPVVTPKGLVGRVILATPISARVLLLTDERFGAGAIIAQTAEGRLLGVLRGRNNSTCELRFVTAPTKLENGEQVITSGQDQLYPKGLLIGQVKNLTGNGAIPQVIDVEPAAAFDKLETVAVLTIPTGEIRRQYDELIKEEKDKEKQKQGKTPDRKKR